MKIRPLIQEKKAVSLMISYVILVIIILAMGIAVWSWTRAYLIVEEKEECPTEIALVIQEYNCNPTKNLLNLTIENKGLFSVDGLFVRATNSTSPESLPIYEINYTNVEHNFIPYTKQDGARIIFSGYDLTTDTYENKFPPNDKAILQFDYKDIKSITKVQIQPYVNSKAVFGEVLLCPNSPTLRVSLDKNCN